MILYANNELFNSPQRVINRAGRIAFRKKTGIQP
jgi:hypothetical protein